MEEDHPLCGNTDDTTTEETMRQKPGSGTTPCDDPATARKQDTGPREGIKGTHNLLVHGNQWEQPSNLNFGWKVVRPCPS